AFRDDPKVLRPLLLEIFYRVTAEFEGQANRRLPKLLEIDEAHHALALPSFRDFIVRKVRTWGKFGAGITLWSQSANDYLRTPDWDAIRGAATTFMFFADPRMDAALYKEAFPLNDGHCEAIRNLVPKRELFLVQPEVGVAKKLILTVEPEQYVVNTSDPHEAAQRDELIARHGFEEGLRLAVEQIHQVNNLIAAE
ncbi:MAG: Type IV secretion, partial [bacterium]|nr:Type IV secretion [bacterium]